MVSGSLVEAEKTVRRKLAGRADITRALREPNLGGVHAFVGLVAACLDDLNRAGGLEADKASLLKYHVIQSSYPALLLYRSGNGEEATEYIIRAWRTEERKLRIHRPSAAGAPHDGERELRSVFNLAVSEVVHAEAKAQQARQILRRLMVHLGLSQDELGRAFGVVGETIRRWERGETSVSDIKMAALQSADSALSKLLSLFRPERLRQVIRRPSEGFQGERALDWIVRGRIAEVADRYDAALRYQA